PVFEPGDNSDRGGAITFRAPGPAFTVTPDAVSTAATGGQKVFSIAAVDQFGAPWTRANGATVGFIENTDDLSSTTTTAVVVWTDNDGQNATSGAVTCGSGPAGTTLVLAPQTTFSLDASGHATFGVCANSATTGTPVVWYDANADSIRESDEP